MSRGTPRDASWPSPARLSFRDIGSEAVAGLLQRPARTILTMLGTVLGIGAFVAILGLTATAQGQISDRFNVLTATQVTVDDLGDPSVQGDQPMSFSLDAGTKAAGIDGVVSAGLWWTVPVDPAGLASNPRSASASGTDTTGLTVAAADPGALAAMAPRGVHGRLYDGFAEKRGARVAVLGAIAAERLGVRRLDSVPAVFIEGVPYTVVGIVDGFDRAPDRLLSVMIPTSSALTAFGPPQSPRASMVSVTRLGAAQVVAAQLAVALRPDHPERLQVAAPADPTTLKNGVANDFNALFLVLATISLAIGAVGIVNTTLVSVLERTPEIGLRRALGARPRHIAFQFLTESLAIGAFGGLLGTSAAILTVVGVAVLRDWTAVLPTWVVVAAPLVGALVGLLAGLYPAVRASRIEPVAALQR